MDHMTLRNSLHIMPLNIFTLGAIEVIQSYKKFLVNLTVRHEGLREVFCEFIDEQTKYTRSAAEASNKAYADVVRLMGRKTFVVEVTEDVYSSYKGK